MTCDPARRKGRSRRDERGYADRHGNSLTHLHRRRIVTTQLRDSLGRAGLGAAIRGRYLDVAELAHAHRPYQSAELLRVDAPVAVDERRLARTEDEHRHAVALVPRGSRKDPHFLVTVLHGDHPLPARALELPGRFFDERAHRRRVLELLVNSD